MSVSYIVQFWDNISQVFGCLQISVEKQAVYISDQGNHANAVFMDDAGSHIWW